MSGLIGQNFERYKILERLGEGGMATVYKAYDARLDREVAIKVIRRDAFPPDQMDMLMKRFERESKSLAKLSHPNIVGVLDYGEFDGSPYLVMEYLSGGTLRERLGKPFPWREAVQMILPIANALEYVHDRSIINRDIKPSNILMTDKGQPMLTDFGLVKLFGDEAKEGTHLTSSGTGLGTPDYMAPEQWTGETTTQSDLYSLGVVLYEMITGHRPYTADTPAGVLLKQATEPLPLPTRYITDLPHDVESVVLKALAKDPKNRYTDMRAFVSELQNLLSGREVMASLTKVETLREQMTGAHRKRVVSPAAPQPSQPMRILPILAGLGVLGLIVVVGAFLFFASSGMFAAPTATPTEKVLPSLTATIVQLTEVPQSTVVPTETALPTETPFPSEITDANNVTMIFIPAGEFTMGSNDTGDVGSQPAHTVNLAAFYIDKYEVTNEMYDACIYRSSAAGGKCQKPQRLSSAKNVNYFGNEVFKDYPVVYITWKMAKTYCEWRGARLPTEAEWEKAARGADANRIYPWDKNILDCGYANYGDCIGDTTSVKQYEIGKSIYGLYNMAGNVWEWTSSLSKPYPYNAADGREDPTTSGNRIVRGGGWSAFGGNAKNIRVDTRLPRDPGYAGTLVGVRCARSEYP
jgi:serine/threonine protein kinase